MKSWTGEYGDKYTEKWVLEPDELDKLWVRMVGQKRSDIITEFLGQPHGYILELGCNCGNQLRMLKHLGAPKCALVGLDINKRAVRVANSRGYNALHWSLQTVPFNSEVFDLVMTCGVLCHVNPRDFPMITLELGRLSPQTIFCTEYCDGKEWDGFRHGVFTEESVLPTGYEVVKTKRYDTGDGSAMIAVRMEKL